MHKETQKLSNFKKTMDELNKCEKENCKTLYKVKNDRIKTFNKLQKKFISDIKKIKSKEDFIKIVQKYKADRETITNDKKYLKKMHDLNNCAIKNCRENITNFFKSSLDAISEECKHEDKGTPICENFDVIDKLLNGLIKKNEKGTLTADDMHEMSVKILTVYNIGKNTSRNTSKK